LIEIIIVVGEILPGSFLSFCRHPISSRGKARSAVMRRPYFALSNHRHSKSSGGGRLMISWSI